VNLGSADVRLFGLLIDKIDLSTCSASREAREVGLVARPGEGNVGFSLFPSGSKFNLNLPSPPVVALETIAAETFGAINPPLDPINEDIPDITCRFVNEESELVVPRQCEGCCAMLIMGSAYFSGKGGICGIDLDKSVSKILPLNGTGSP
jgi:hypothetical protein